MSQNHVPVLTLEDLYQLLIINARIVCLSVGVRFLSVWLGRFEKKKKVFQTSILFLRCANSDRLTFFKLTHFSLCTLRAFKNYVHVNNNSNGEYLHAELHRLLVLSMDLRNPGIVLRKPWIHGLFAQSRDCTNE